MEKLKKSVGIRAQSIRERHGFKNREQLAEILGVHNNTVGFLERGETWLSPEMAVLYRDKLGIDPAEFLTEKPVIIKPTPRDAVQVLAEFIDKNDIFKSPLLNQASSLLSEITEEDLPGVIGFLKTTVAKDEAVRSGLLDEPGPVKKSKIPK